MIRTLRLGTGATASIKQGLIQLAVLIVALAIQLGWRMGEGFSSVACAAILLFGLPHGTLDLEIIKRERGAGRSAMAALLLLYVALAVGVFLLWQISSVIALGAFLIVAVIHFAEDWEDAGSPFLAQGMALALLSAPALLHLRELERIFGYLSTSDGGTLVANLMLLFAPVSLLVAAVCVTTLWSTGRKDQALVGFAVLAGMVLLPPIVGFALFFCVFHSPRHLSDAAARVAHSPIAAPVVLWLTLAALGVATALFSFEVRADFSSQITAASFMTLSILTVPHMLVPFFAKSICPASPSSLPSLD
jgi:beta-carotene 15,15'-dioxygenase